MSTPQDQQELLQLIYALKALAMTVDSMHQDLRRLLLEEGRDREHDLDKLRTSIERNQQTLQVVPITVSDRIESIIDRKVDGVMDDVRNSLIDLRQKLNGYLDSKKGPAFDSGIVRKAIKDSEKEKDEDITGRIELHKGGAVKVLFGPSFFKRLKITLYVILGAGGAGGLVKLVADYMR